MTADRDDLRDRLDDIGEQVDGDDSMSDFGPTIIFGDGEGGYETPDGDPIPTDDDGSPDVDGNGPAIILSREYCPDDARP
jgi:hypothetical protein